MALDLSAAANILKTRYLGTIREQLNNATVLLSKIEKREQMVSGKNFTFALHTGRNIAAGIGRADGGALPTAGAQAYETAVCPNVYSYGRIQITGPTIAATKDNVGAFAQAIESEVDGLTRDFKKSFNHQLNGDGRGALAYWTSADDHGTGDTVTLDDSQGNAFVHLQQGVATTCDLIDASDGYTKVGNSIVCTLGAKGATTYSMTYTGAVSGSADGDFLVNEDTVPASQGQSYNLMGLAGIVRATDPPGMASLHGLAVGTYPWWKGQVFNASGTQRQLAFEDMQEVIDAIATTSDFTEADIDLLLCNYPVRRSYYKLCVSERRHINTMTLDGGFKALEFNGMPLVADAQCKRNSIWFLVTQSLVLLRTGDFDWMDKDGNMLSRVAGYDAYEATLCHYGNLACTARNANGELGDILED